MGGTEERLSARERILQTAVRLFYEHGYHRVGIDRIIAESGVAKMSLYRHFPSKDKLVVASLERVNGEFWEWIDAETARAATPEAKLIAIFRAVGEAARSKECLGCAFQGAAADFPDNDHLNHQVAIAHKNQVLERFTKLAASAGFMKPKRLARQLLLLMDGAWASARMYGAKGPAAEVVAAAQTLIEASRPEAPQARGGVRRKATQK
jgi:AcrR family transcriptional regulator